MTSKPDASKLIRRWRGSAVVIAAATAIAVTAVTGGNQAIGILLTVLFLCVAFLVSPLLFPGGPDWRTAQQLARTRGVPLILWKPGCWYSIRLRLALRAAGRRAIWVDIWADEEAAAATRELNHGNETTPTVITTDGARTNPDPSWVNTQLEAS
ncbi:glutaredoxin domain-containing protein [Micromonosporaceae bacterium Da 78-11]